MISKKRRNILFLEAFIVTVLIYFLAFLFNFYLDDLRTADLEEGFYQSEINFNTINTFEVFESNFDDEFDCLEYRELMFDIFYGLKGLGVDLGNYGNLFSKDNSNVSFNKQREYFLRQIALENVLSNYNEVCFDEKIVKIVYFFDSKKVDLDKQSLILEQFAIDNKNKTIVFSYDINYNDEPILEGVKDIYDISFSPFIIIGNKTSRDLLADADLIELNVLTLEFLKIRGEI